MKQFIVLCAVLPLLLLFVCQYALDQRNHALTAYVEETVRASCEEARAEGYFSPAIRKGLKEKLAEKLGIGEGDILITAGTTVVYRLNSFDGEGKRGLIPYSISVPIGKAMATGLFSLTGDNRRIVTISGSLASERLP